MVTALEYLKEGGSVTDEYDCGGTFGDEDYKIHCVNNKSHGHQTLTEAFETEEEKDDGNDDVEIVHQLFSLQLFSCSVCS
jgi:hypothetical protein